MNRIIFDTETTGLPRASAVPLIQQPHIIEFGAIKVDEDFNELSRINVLINPGIPLPQVIIDITGITDEDLKDAPPFSGVIDEIVEFFNGETEAELIAHNAAFDVKMLKFELARLGVEEFPWPRDTVCTIELTRHLHKKRLKLEYLWSKATGEEPKQTHRAVEDCEMLLTVCKYLRKEGLM